ncbi:MAG TPA: hypothetical protein V6C95_02860, partial [Coleofasciculaceae cyanobacterium]
MPVSKVAIYTLAALTASAFSDEANASPSLTLQTTELEADNFVGAKTTTPEPTQGKNAICASQQRFAIAPPEMLETQPYTSVTGSGIRERQGETQSLITITPTSEVSQQPLNPVHRNPIDQATSEPLAQVSLDEKADRESSPTNPSEPPSAAELLQTRQPVLTTADQLRQGEVITNFRYRQTFPEGTADSIGLTGQPTFGVTWGVTNDLELTLEAQTVDNSGPVTQGSFNAQRINPDGTGPNFFQEITLQAKQRIWQNQDGTQSLSGVAAASLGNAGRPFRFFNSESSVSNGENQGVVTSLELPFTFKTDDRWQFTVSPKVAFLPNDHALYFNRPPINNPGSFGTTLGLAGGVSYQLNPRFILWGDAFVPFTGNNTINRDTG